MNNQTKGETGLKGNVISSPTFRYLNVNEIINLPELNDKPSFNFVNQSVDTAKLDEQFKSKKFGINENYTQRLLNAASSKKYINIHENTTAEEKINYNQKNENPDSELENLIKIQIGKNAKAKIFINYYKTGTFKNSLTLIYAGENSISDIYVTDLNPDIKFDFESIAIITEKNAKVNLKHIIAGGKENALNIQSFIDGDNSAVDIKGFYFLSKDDKLDLLYNSIVSGKKSNACINVKGALKDTASKTFKGTIDFRRGAFGSVGDESETVYLLDNSVVSKSLPVLLCTEEDVKGSHAASAGKIDPETLFYLMSRGYTESLAQAMIVLAGLNPLIDELNDDRITLAAKNYIVENLEDLE